MVDPWAVALATGGIAAGVSLAATGAAVIAARRWGVLDVPNQRSSHSAPTPRLGGVGLTLGVLASLVPAVDAGEAFVMASSIIWACALGLWDDRSPLGPAVKMIGALLVALIPVACDLAVVRRVSGIPWTGVVELGALAAPLSLIWIACYPNAFNFMDGLNGIAALSAAVTGVIFAVAGVSHYDACLAALGAAAAGASLGFLPWNFPVARTFMGDGGSLPLGLLLALCSVQAQRTGALPFPASVLLLGPFMFDVTFTLVRRAREGKAVGEAHKEHLYQRLSRLWGSHAKVSLLYASFSVVTGALALAYDSMSDAGKLLSLVGPLAAMLGFAALVLRAERRKGV